MTVRVSLPTISEDAMVVDAVASMLSAGHGVVAVVDHEGRLTGLFTFHDLANRVVHSGRDAATTIVADVMTREIHAVRDGGSTDEAFRTIVEKGLGYLPVVDSSGRPRGMYEYRSLLLHRLQSATSQLESIISYFSADGIGGD